MRNSTIWPPTSAKRDAHRAAYHLHRCPPRIPESHLLHIDRLPRPQTGKPGDIRERTTGRVSKLIDSRGALLPGRDIRLRGELSPGIVMLGSEEMIETVVENLIDNAASYSPAGSEVLVRLRRARCPPPPQGLPSG